MHKGFYVYLVYQVPMDLLSLIFLSQMFSWTDVYVTLNHQYRLKVLGEKDHNKMFPNERRASDNFSVRVSIKNVKVD